MESGGSRAPFHVVVIGGGVAGTTCAAELVALTREENFKVTLIDPQPVIKACAIVAKITRAAFDVSISENDANRWCQKHGITFVQDRAVRVQNQEVHCETGAKFPFSACCIATGARPYVPPVLRVAEFSDNVATLRDTDSVESLKTKLARAKRAVIVGGGGIAMEAVHEITGCELVWLMKGTHIGSAFFDQRGGECLSQLFGLDMYLRNQSDRDSTSLSVFLDEDNQPSVFQPHLPTEATEARVRSRQPTPVVSYGSGVGPEWISRRFEPMLLDEKGNIERRPPDMYTELKGSNDPVGNRVQIVLRSEVNQLVKDRTRKWPVVATLSDGSEIGCDIILAGTGVVPNVEWLHGSGIDVDWDRPSDSRSIMDNEAPGGILVSAEDLSTNVCGVFAAGDCTTVKPGTGGSDWRQMRLWTQARTAGRACAQSMAAFLRGEEPACAGLDFEVFAHATQFFDKKVVLLGRYNAQGLERGYEILESGGEKEDGYYVRAVVHDGRVRGALLVGEVDKAETFENLILDGLDVSRFGAELVDPNFEIEDYFD